MAQDVFEYAKSKHFISEVYEVVKTIELVTDFGSIRIEAVKRYSNGESYYATHSYNQIRSRLKDVQETDNGKDIGTEDIYYVWVLDTSAPWTSRDTADGALAQAIGFLSERSRAR